MRKSIEVTIKTDGKVEIEAIGFKGGACEKATQAIEQALGTVAARKKKPEYYQQNITGNTQST